MKQLLTYALLLGLLAPATAVGQFVAPRKISATTGHARGSTKLPLTFSGENVAYAGDIDDDGTADLVLVRVNAVWVLFMNADGTVRSYRKNAVSDAGITTAVGTARVTTLGDLDGDGVPDLVLSGGWIWYLNRDGTVKGTKQVCDDDECVNRLSSNVGPPMDINGNGVPEIVAPVSGLAGLYIFFLDARGDEIRRQRICHTVPAIPTDPTCSEGGFSGEVFQWTDQFGASATNMEDLNGDGVPDLAVGESNDDDGCPDLNPDCSKGAVWVLFLREDGTIRRNEKISSEAGGFTGVLPDTAWFGDRLASLDDLDGDGRRELAVGAPAPSGRGAVWILSLNDATDAPVSVAWEQEITGGKGGFMGLIRNEDRFGFDITRLGDIDDDPETRETLVVPAGGDPGEGDNTGALWVLFLKADGTVQRHRKILVPDFLFTLQDEDHFGRAVAALGDLDGDGTGDLAVGAPGTDGGGTDQGAVWILFLTADGQVKRHQKIDAVRGGFGGVLGDGDGFGTALAPLGNGRLAVGAPGDDGGGEDRGAVWVLDLGADGTVTRHRKINGREGSFGGVLGDGDGFGAALASLGDGRLTVGAPGDDEGGPDGGAVWVLDLGADGTVTGQAKTTFPGGLHAGRVLALLGARGGVHGLAVGADGDEGLYVLDLDADGIATIRSTLAAAEMGVDAYSGSLASLGDIDGNGLAELALGTRTGGAEGVTWLVLRDDGSLRHAQTIESPRPALRMGFGNGLAGLDDVDGDGIPELAVGVPLDPDGGAGRGALWLMSLPGLREVFGTAIEPPVVGPETPTAGRDVMVSTRVSDFSGQGIDQVEISFRRAGDPTFFEAPMRDEGEGRYAFTIPAFATSPRGVQYVVTAENALGLAARYPGEGIASVAFHVVEGLSAPLPSGSEASAYRLYTVPLDLDEPGLKALLEDDLGSYNRARWRAYTYRGDNRFLELGDLDTNLQPGDTFWLLVKDDGRTLTTGPGTSVPTDQPFPVRLQRGWTFVGSPFTFPVPVDNLRTASGQPVQVVGYDGSWSAVDSLLVPMTGYAVWNATTEMDTLWIDPNASEATAHPAAKVAEEWSWSIHITARHGAARDDDNIAAVSETASAAWDRLDRPEPPVIGDYVAVSFSHPEWHRAGTRYSHDVRPEPGEWVFEVATATAGRVALTFEGLAEVPEGYGVWLEDEAAGVRQNLRAEASYAVATSGDGVARRLTLVVAPLGAASEASEVPATVELLANFPNPFAEATTLRFGLPEAAAVEMSVYDLLGRRVAVPVVGEWSAGYHAVVWDGHDGSGRALGSGVYVVRLVSGGAVRTRRVVRVR